MHIKKKRKAQAYVVITLILLLLFLASGGFYGGFMLVIDPSGGSLQVPAGFLDKLPINTFLLPGLFLLLFFGILPLLAVSGLIFRKRLAFLMKINPVGNWKWPVTLSFLIGVTLVCWTTGEILLWGMNRLSGIYFCYGLMVTLFSLLAVREF